MKPQTFAALTILAFAPTLGVDADRPAFFRLVDEGGGATPRTSPERPDLRQPEIPRSHMDPAMQHLQEGRSDSRGSVTPPNLDPTMSSNPDVDPSMRKDPDGHRRGVPEQHHGRQ